MTTSTPLDWQSIFLGLKSGIERFGVAVAERQLGPETTGTFDGLNITTNTLFDAETRCHNMAHSFGHIAQWSLDFERFRTLYDDLYAAKAEAADHPQRLEAALARFREYEEEASEYAAWLYLEIGCPEAIPAFTNFARADIEAIVGFHRDGIAPRWCEFFSAWNTRVACGECTLQAFTPRPVPPFIPRKIDEQEIIQEVDGLP